MSLGFSRCELALLGWVASTCLSLNVACAQSKPQARRSIELSETNSAEILTNLNQLNSTKEGLTPLEEQLRTLKALMPAQTMEDFSMPYVPPRAGSSKRLKELLDRQKNWALTPEALSLSATLQDSETMFATGEDKKGAKKSALQQFYDALTPPELSSSETAGQRGNRSNDKNSPFRKMRDARDSRRDLGDNRRDESDSSNVEDDSNLPPEIRNETKQIKKSMNEDSGGIFSPLRSRSGFDNFFGLSDKDKDATSDPLTPPKPSGGSFLEQYKKGLDPSVAVGLNPALGALLPTDPIRGAAISPDLVKLPRAVRHEASDSTPGNINSVLTGTAVSDPNAAVLNQWNPLYTPSKLELPKVVSAPTVPAFDLPRRRF